MWGNFEGAEIYYTTDGKIPDFEGNCSSTKMFTEAISVEIPALRNPLQRFVAEMLSVTAVAVMRDSDPESATSREARVSEPVSRNFIRGEGVFERFGTEVLVFALNSEPHGLYDHHDGIFVEGIDRELWRAENNGRSGSPPDPANFNRRGRMSEREVHVEVFDSEGSVLISQRAGMRVRGGWSRADTQKSLELFARRQYSPGRNTFDFGFFGDSETDSQGVPVEQFRRIRLRNGGNDREFGTVRDELSHTLFGQAGFPDVQQHTPAAVFLNGEYYGFAWLKTPRTEDHWQRRYGGRITGFEHIGDGESDWRELPEHWNGNPRAVEDWHEVIELVRKGLTDSARWEEFTDRVCIENLMLYYALQLYINNDDWPQGNMEMWRYFPEDDENPETLHPFLSDGKWRFIAQDIEFAWNLYSRSHDSNNPIESVRTGRGQMGGQSEILDALLRREDMRRMLADRLVDLMEGAFRPENVRSVLESLIQMNGDEVNIALAAGMYSPDNPHWPTRGSMNASQRDIRTFAGRRPRNMVDFIRDSLDIEVTVSYL
jgi:hypothetical protein